MDIAFNLAKENAETIAEKIIEITEALIAAYQGVAGDADSLGVKLETVKYLVEDVRSCGSMPGNHTLVLIHKKVYASSIAIKEFQDREAEIKESKNVFKKSAFKVKRFFIYAPDYTAQFKSLSEALDSLPIEFEKIKKLSESLVKTNNLSYKDDFINDECRKFWISIAGSDIGSKKDCWSLFRTKYDKEYLSTETKDEQNDSKKEETKDDQNEEKKDKKDSKIERRQWTATEWDKVKSAACLYNTDLTLFGFISLTNRAGFPINIDEVPSVLDSNHSMTDSSRIEVGKMINDLIAKFSSEEMNNHIVSVIKWYIGFSKEQLKDLVLPEKGENETDDEKNKRKDLERKLTKQFKADECYKIIKRLREEDKPYEECTDREKMALDVEKARRQVVYFYQQFLVICEFGRLSRTIFENVDFPGKARLRSFIGDYRPLDKANYRVIIKRTDEIDDKEWEQKQPKVYKFLEDFLKTQQTRPENDAENEFNKKSYESKQNKLDERKKELDKREAKLKKLEELEKKLAEQESGLLEREEILSENEKKHNKQMAKVRLQSVVSQVIQKQNDEPKNSLEKDKGSVQKWKKKLESKVEDKTSKKTDGRRESITSVIKNFKAKA